MHLNAGVAFDVGITILFEIYLYKTFSMGETGGFDQGVADISGMCYLCIVYE